MFSQPYLTIVKILSLEKWTVQCGGSLTSSPWWGWVMNSAVNAEGYGPTASQAFPEHIHNNFPNHRGKALMIAVIHSSILSL